MSALDTMFNQAAAQISIPCSALGTNAISLTPLVNCPALTSYNELGGYRFRAVGNSTGAVTAQYNGLGFLPVYHADGVTQCNVSDIVIGEQYIFTYSAALNGGLGGFFAESPSLPLAATTWQVPGGRLTLQSAVPVMTSNQLTKQTIFYAPYNNQFCPIYNGANVQMYDFCSSTSDQVGQTFNLGGAANFPNGANFDLFLTLIGGVPAIVAIQWTNTSTRATGLSIFGGFLTNGGAATAQTGPNTSVTLPVNQGTYLGTFNCSAQGQTQWQFGGSATGGTAGSFNIANYYNAREFVSITTDSGTTYTYTSNVVRQARASAGMQCSFVQCSSELAVLATYTGAISTAAALNALGETGIGVNTTTAFNIGSFIDSETAASLTAMTTSSFPFTFTGFGFVAALEASDNVNANTFGAGSAVFQNRLMVRIWL